MIVLGVLAAIVYAGMFALATFVKPTPREMQVRVPTERLGN